MFKQCVVAEFEDVATARLGLEILAKAGYGENQVSFVSRTDAPELQDVPKLRERDTSETAAAGGSGTGIGALLGGALSAPVAASTLLGPFILVGPLVGAGIGAALGGMLGGAESWGVDKNSSQSYEERVEAGSVLIMVTGEEHEVREATASLKTAGPIHLQQFARPESESA